MYKNRVIHNESSSMLYTWFPRSPDHTPCDYLFWVCNNNTMYVPYTDVPPPILYREVKISGANYNGYAWNDFDFRLNVVLVTRESHIKYLFNIIISFNIYNITSIIR